MDETLIDTLRRLGAEGPTVYWVLRGGDTIFLNVRAGEAELRALGAKVKQLRAYRSAMKAVKARHKRLGPDDGTIRWFADSEIRKAFADVDCIVAEAAGGDDAR